MGKVNTTSAVAHHFDKSLKKDHNRRKKLLEALQEFDKNPDASRFNKKHVSHNLISIALDNFTASRALFVKDQKNEDKLVMIYAGGHKGYDDLLDKKLDIIKKVKQDITGGHYREIDLDDAAKDGMKKAYQKVATSEASQNIANMGVNDLNRATPQCRRFHRTKALI